LKPPAKGTNPKKKKAKYLLFTEFNLTHSSDEDEEYFVLPYPMSNASNKLVKTSHQTSKLVVSLNVNHEEHLLRALTDTGASSSIILEAYAPKNLIKYDEEQKTTWSIMGGQFTTDKTTLVTFSLPEFNLKKQISWIFHLNDRLKTAISYTYNGFKSSDRVLRWLLLLEEYGVTFEYPPGKKSVVADALSCLDIDELKNTPEEVLTLLSGSEHSNINFPMYTALIFSEQLKVPGLRDMGLSQPYYSMQHIEGYDLVCYKDKIYIPQSLRQKVLSWYHDTYFIQDKLELRKLSGIP
jgi:Aspartyl protease